MRACNEKTNHNGGGSHLIDWGNRDDWFNLQREYRRVTIRISS